MLYGTLIGIVQDRPSLTAGYAEFAELLEITHVPLTIPKLVRENSLYRVPDAMSLDLAALSQPSPGRDGGMVCLGTIVPITLKTGSTNKKILKSVIQHVTHAAHRMFGGGIITNGSSAFYSPRNSRSLPKLCTTWSQLPLDRTPVQFNGHGSLLEKRGSDKLAAYPRQEIRRYGTLYTTTNLRNPLRFQWTPICTCLLTSLVAQSRVFLA